MCGETESGQCFARPQHGRIGSARERQRHEREMLMLIGHDPLVIARAMAQNSITLVCPSHPPCATCYAIAPSTRARQGFGAIGRSCAVAGASTGTASGHDAWGEATLRVYAVLGLRGGV
jgi:hypothetical protein